MSSFERLDRLAKKYRTDKGTKAVNGLVGKSYTRIYAEYLEPLRYREISLLEIGVYNGGSLNMWHEFMPNAQIFGVDINSQCKQYEGDRCRILVGDQADPQFLDAVIEEIGRSPDVIIDDGSHKVKDQITTLKHLFSRLAPGGLYFIEDVHTAYWKSYGGGVGDRRNTVELAKGMVEQLNRHIAFDSTEAGWWHRVATRFDPVFDDVYSVQFFPSLILLMKSSPGQ